VEFFQFTQSFQPHYGPGVDSASNRNEYQESSWGVKGRPAHKADKLTAICEPIVSKMWEPRRLTTLWAFTACYMDNFTFSYSLLLFLRKITCSHTFRIKVVGSSQIVVSKEFNGFRVRA
jgi:hypothetical protein